MNVIDEMPVSPEVLAQLQQYVAEGDRGREEATALLREGSVPAVMRRLRDLLAGDVEGNGHAIGFLSAVAENAVQNVGDLF